MDLKEHNNLFLWAFLLASLLLHLAVLRLLPGISLPEPAAEKKPVYVEIRPVAQEPQKVELDVEPDPALATPRERPAKRIGPIDQNVTVETAPRGEGVEDTRPDAAAPEVQQVERAQTGAAQSGLPLQPSTATDRATGEPLPVVPQPRPDDTPGVPAVDPKSLLQLTDSTIVATLDKEWQRAERDDMLEGDSLRFDLQHDLLSSFFYRFRDNIRLVWNYPAAAGDRGQEGTVVLAIRINHDGTVNDVELLRSSGYQILDNAAMAAVRRAAPYGDLPARYREDVLDFSVSFIYQIVGRRRLVN